MTFKIKNQTENILKPLRDDRKYRAFQLENDMRVLVASDPNTEKSSAALSVNVGYLKDPVKLPGLAHFCEHMLFMGTKKYPEENDYSKYLSEHGGESNAMTSDEETNYFFEVLPNFLQGALDRFAQFFLAPLFTESATSRELNAIDSEHLKNVQNDGRRVYQLEKSTLDHNHDYAKFSTGNKKTLSEDAKKAGINIRNELLIFHKKYYSSNLMSLVVLGKESLDDLTKMVVDLFSSVENKNVTPPHWDNHPFKHIHAKKKLLIVPIKDIQTLTLTWPIPDLHPLYKTNPGHYIGHLIGHEGPGSLLSELKKRGWVNSLMAGETGGASGFMFFQVNVDLTEIGIKYVDEITFLVFQYIRMIKKEGIQEWIFKECQLLSDIHFKFRDQIKSSHFTSNIASIMRLYPLEEVLSAGYYYNEFKPNIIENILDKLTPDNFRQSILSKEFKNLTSKVEKWYGTEYSLEPIHPNYIDQWSNPSDSDVLYLPERNHFIPQLLDIIPVDPNITKSPLIINETKMSRLWFCQDSHFKMPKSCCSIEIYAPLVYHNPTFTNYAYIFCELIKDSLNEYVYSAELAGLKYDISNNIYGFEISVNGFSDKQIVLLEKILEKLIQIKFDQKRYNILMEKYVKNLRNFRAEQPHKHAIYYTSLLLSEQSWSKEDLLEAVQEMNFEDLSSVIPQMFKQIFIETLVYGNISLTSGRKIGKLIEDQLMISFKSKPLIQSEQRRYREVQLKDGCYYFLKTINEVHPNSSIEIYYQCFLRAPRENALIELFCQIIDEPCFDILRTQEQLGYIVFSGVRKAHRVQGVRVIIQSDKSPEFLEERIEKFLKKMRIHINNMPNDIFQKHIDSLALLKLEKPKKIKEQNLKFWYEIYNQYYFFNRDEKEVEYLRSMTKADILGFYDVYISPTSTKRHKLSVLVSSYLLPPHRKIDNPASKTLSVTGSSVDVDTIEPLETVEIKNISVFKRELPLFPHPYYPVNKSKL